MRKFLPPMRLGRCLLLVWAVAALFAIPAVAAGLECPEAGQTAVPDLTSDPGRAKLLLGGTGALLPNPSDQTRKSKL